MRSAVERLARARELARLLELIYGEAWEDVYADLIINQGGDLPDLEELEDDECLD